jgi:hypothetical protein
MLDDLVYVIMSYIVKIKYVDELRLKNCMRLVL